MVTVQAGGRTYEYPNMVVDRSAIDKQVCEDFKAFLKRQKKIKGRFVEDLYKQILFLDRLGRLDDNNYVVTIDLKSLGKKRSRM